MDGYPVGLVGESNYQQAIRACREGQRVRVLHEVGNPYDEHALVVITDAGEKLGYIARSCWLREAIHDEAKGCDATVAAVRPGESGAIGVVVEIVLNPDGVEQCTYRP